MYGIFTYIHHKNQPNVGKYNIPYMDPMGNIYIYIKQQKSLPNGNSARFLRDGFSGKVEFL